MQAMFREESVYVLMICMMNIEINLYITHIDQQSENTSPETNIGEANLVEGTGLNYG